MLEREEVGDVVEKKTLRRRKERGRVKDPRQRFRVNHDSNNRNNVFDMATSIAVMAARAFVVAQTILVGRSKAREHGILPYGLSGCQWQICSRTLFPKHANWAVEGVSHHGDIFMRVKPLVRKLLRDHCSWPRLIRQIVGGIPITSPPSSKH